MLATIRGVDLRLMFLALFSIFASIFFGLVISFGASYFLVIFLGFTISTFFLVFFLQRGVPFSNCLFYLLLIFIFLNGVLKRYQIPVDAVYQIIIGFSALYAVFALKLKFFCKENMYALFCFLLFLFLLILSTAFSRSINFAAASFQLLSNLKLMLAMLAMALLLRKINLASLMPKIVWIYITVSAIFVLLQWFLPEIYSIFKSYKPSYIITASYLPPQAYGTFSHPSHFASVSSVLAIYVLVQFFYKTNAIKMPLFALFSLFTLLLVAAQRQELAAFFVVSILLFIFQRREDWLSRTAVSLIPVCIFSGLFFALFSDTLIKEFNEWGLGYHGSVHPREKLWEGALLLAKEHFPLGSGAGTWAGVGAMKFNLDLFYELRINTQWWWRNYDSYLLDTYWPNPLAESGYFGSIALLGYFVLTAIYFLRYAAKNIKLNASHNFWLVAAMTLFYVLLITPTSPGFQEMLLVLFPAMFYGYAINAENT